MSLELKSHEQISSNESIIETIIIKGKKPLKKQRKIFIYFIILFVLISIILFDLFLIYKKYHKNTLNIFNNITSSDLIIENKAQTHEHIINKTGSIIKNNDNMSDMTKYNIDSNIIIDKNTDKNIIKNTSIYPWEKEKLITHALGEYNQIKYTNSLEALNYWYFEEKMTVLEADFYLTKDNHIILAHDFKHSKRIPTLDEFKNKMRTRGNLTTMTFEDLVIFMEKNKNLYIITDTKYTDLRSIK